MGGLSLRYAFPPLAGLAGVGPVLGATRYSCIIFRAMKVVIAPQAFKGSISALEAAEAMSDGIRRVVDDAQTVLVPVADGGDGTLETLVQGSGGEIRSAKVTGPLGESIVAEWGAMGDGRTAVIEMARTSGLALVPIGKRNPLITTTYGLGQAIGNALDAGFRKFIVGIGGSATNDAGAGMAQALGISLLDDKGCNLPFGGSALARLDRIDLSGLDPRARQSQFQVACDVSNVLTGPEGAAAVYGPQKGATPAMVAQLDEALLHFAAVVKRDLGSDIEEVPGAGAAGGLGGGLIAFLEGELRAGVDIVLDTVSLDEELERADLVITGEGCLDRQTLYNKAPIGVAERAKARDIPVIAISGMLGDGYREIHSHGIDAAAAITCAPMTLDESVEQAAMLVADATEEALRFMRVGSRVFRGS